MSFQVKYIYDLVDKISPQLAKIQASVQQTSAKIEQSAARASNSFNNLGNNLKQISGNFRSAGMSLLPASAGITAIGVGAVKSAANFETLQMQMEVLTGSAEKGKEVFDKLVKLGAETPFELKDLAKANNTLMGYGQTAEQAFHQVQLIGDISAISGGDLQGITVAFGQAAASGRLMGQDLLQLVNNGVPVIDLLSKTMKVPKERIKEMVSQGAVTFPVLLKAFEEATGKGGKFENGMLKLSGTLGGLYSTLRDNLNIALAQFGQEIVKVLDLKNSMKAFNETIARMTQSFKELSPETKKFILYAAGLIAVLAPILITISLMLPALALLAKGIGGVSLAMQFLAANPIVALLASMALLYTQWEDFAKIVDWVGGLLLNAFNSPHLGKFIQDLGIVLDYLSKIGEFFVKYPKMLGNFVADKINARLDAEAGIKSQINQAPNINQRNSLSIAGMIGVQVGQNAPTGTTASFINPPQISYNQGTMGALTP